MNTNEILQTGESVSAPIQGHVKPPNRILVVDDDICIRQISVGVLTTIGSRVDTAEDGETGWEALQAKTYDLLIADTDMPKMSGVELVEKLRSARMTLPVVLASATLPTETLKRNPSLQLAATLPKPFTMGELLGTVKEVLCGGIIGMKPLDILLIDDDHNDCALLGTAIDKTGLNICLQTVTDGEEAKEYLEGRGVYADRSLHPLPALVLLDLDMRLTGGLAFSDWRRASASFSSLPVVIFSAFAYKGAIETALAMGANTRIAKPFGFEGWKAVVWQIWDLGITVTQVGGQCSAEAA